ncbi:type II and III secretion system protein family protein [Siculibacillus lacustris]|uniref:Type II and III secretion system protein family protein n=1 Tax=Siculibacillus lacustris TaxID=1549641 RepID=A0A4V2KTY5_9HYPH|nr:type II and III secretion system protein family protein [Siculibacillus lacustris]TBW39225.1 type II and III secretion system protein family protein [Siculibacillus lacustris]
MSGSLVHLRRTALAVAAMVGACLAVPAPQAAEPAAAVRLDRTQASLPRGDRVVQLPLSKSQVLDFDEEIRDVLVSDPKIADAVVRSSRRLYLIGNKFGTTNIVVFGASGRPIANIELQVQLDTRSLEGLLKRLLPRSDIRAEAVAGTVVLSGAVGSASEAVQAYEVATRFVGNQPDSGGGAASGGSATTGGSSSAGSTVQVVNTLTIRGKDQVMLKVTIAEVQRQAVKMLGINLTNTGTAESTAANGLLTGLLGSSGNFGTNAVTTNSFPINSGVTTALDQRFSWDAGGFKLRARLQALEQASLMKTLAEPNLTALSGEQAQFLVGGEYPVPIVTQNAMTVEFKNYGIALNFQPVVLADDRISLTVKTEVSELTSDGAVTVSGITIPALRIRRASTTLEMPSGAMMVLGGLIKDDVKQAISGTPGLLDIPILGTLFRSRDFQQSQSELAIFIQPVLVRPVAASKLQRPDQNFQPANDAAGYFLGRLNRIYRAADRTPGGSYRGRVGYIYE